MQVNFTSERQPHNSPRVIQTRNRAEHAHLALFNSAQLSGTSVLLLLGARRHEDDDEDVVDGSGVPPARAQVVLQAAMSDFESRTTTAPSGKYLDAELEAGARHMACRAYSGPAVVTQRNVESGQETRFRSFDPYMTQKRRSQMRLSGFCGGCVPMKQHYVYTGSRWHLTLSNYNS